MEGIMDSASKEGLLLRFNFDWDLKLDQKIEKNPEVHFYLSTNYSTEVKTIELETANNTKTSGTERVKLHWKKGALFNSKSASTIIAECNLNIDFYTHMVNAYDEPVTNPAGSVIIPLWKILGGFMNAKSGEITENVTLFMIHDETKRVKGTIRLRKLVISSNVQTPLPFLLLNGTQVTMKDFDQVLIDKMIDRNEKMKLICAKYIEATEVLYEGVDPTIESVANINSALWVSRSSVKPPLAFTLDYVKPVITEKFYLNCLDIVLSRFDMTRGDVEKLDISGDNKEQIELIGSIAGQILCCYTIHSTYRADFAIVWDSLKKRFDRIATENFGDMSVDKGAGDCEDGGKIIIRIDVGLLRYNNQTTDPALQKIITFLLGYYPFLTLLGVSSAQINAAPSDIVNMGAHENAILIPLQQFMDELIRSNPSAKVWKEQILTKDFNNQTAVWESSSKYPVLVLEGTGVLEPVMRKEEALTTRIILESFMDETVFYALRRSYYYDENNTSFYKTVEKIFTPMPILEGGSFGSFLLMHKKDDGKDNNSKTSLRKRITKSVSFSEFITDSDTVSIFMEPEFTDAEKLAISHAMKDVHPPVPLDAPSNPPLQKQKQCDILIESFKKSLLMLVPNGDSYALSSVKKMSSKWTIQTYYWRSGKVNKLTCDKVLNFLGHLPKGMLIGYQMFSEWVTDEVGGYRLALIVSNSAIEAQWKLKNYTFSVRKLGSK